MHSRLRGLAQAGLVFNAPLSEQRAAALVRALPLTPGGHVLDLGCGSAELLLRVVDAHPAATGTGVDLDRAALDRGRRAATARGLAEHVDLVEGDAAHFEDRGDVVLCIGAAHVWGDATAALRALRGAVEPGGRLLFGDAFWERPPGAEARRLFGELPVWEGLLSIARGAGWRIVDAQATTREEWDAWEAGWRAGLDAAGDPEAAALAAERAHEYDAVLRGVLGFAWLVLA